MRLRQAKLDEEKAKQEQAKQAAKKNQLAEAAKAREERPARGLHEESLVHQKLATVTARNMELQRKVAFTTKATKTKGEGDPAQAEEENARILLTKAKLKVPKPTAKKNGKKPTNTKKAKKVGKICLAHPCVLPALQLTPLTVLLYRPFCLSYFLFCAEDL